MKRLWILALLAIIGSCAGADQVDEDISPRPGGKSCEVDSE